MTRKSDCPTNKRIVKKLKIKKELVRVNEKLLINLISKSRYMTDQSISGQYIKITYISPVPKNSTKCFRGSCGLSQSSGLPI